MKHPTRRPSRRGISSSGPFGPAGALVLASGLLGPAVALAAAGHGGTIQLKPGRATTSNDFMNVGDTYQETITTSCYDVDGNPLTDTVTLTVTGQPDTGGATATFNPNPQQTFSAGALFQVTTTKKTDAKVYSMVLTGTGPVCGQYGTLTLPLSLYPVLSLSRQDLVTVQATGKPVDGGTFAYVTATAGGTICPTSNWSGYSSGRCPFSDWSFGETLSSVLRPSVRTASESRATPSCVSTTWATGGA